MFRFVPILLLLLSVLNAHAQSLNRVENELLMHLEALEKASNYGGNSDYAVLARENKALRDAFIKLGRRADVLAYGFPKLSEKMFVTTSKDGRLRAYSWDTEQGGTMHDYITVYQFKGKSGRTYSWTPPYSEDISGYGAGSFVHQIFQTNAKSGSIYLTVSTFIGSTSLAGQSITAFRVNSEKLDPKAKAIKTTEGITHSVGFGYGFFSVVDRPERPIKLFSYDEAKREFRFPVVVEDEKTPQGRVTNKLITYRFNGTHFVKVR